jgi:AraC-like DNA-binding protein
MPAYREHAPAPDLAPWIQCHWTVQATAAPPLPNRVLPDGCADVIVDLARGVYAFAVGPMRTAAVVDVAGRVDLLGVRFRPGAAALMLDAPLGEMCDLHVPLDALWGRVAAELGDALAAAPARDRVRHVERVLRARLSVARPGRDGGDVVAHAVALFRRARGGVGVQAVASALGVHERRLERAFAHHVGLSPKFLARVERFRHAVALIDHAAPRPWSAIAYEAGYADQAHLVREFRALAGLTPTALAAERRRVGFVQYDEGGGS